MSVVLVLVLVVGVFVGGGVSLVSAQTSDETPDGQARIWARRLDSGNVEFGLRVDSRGGVDETFSNRFLVYGVAEAGVWYASEPKLVNLGTGEAGPRVVLRILARRLNSGNVEFGLRVDNDKTWLPDARYFPYSSTAVGSRLYSSRLVVSVPGSESPAMVESGPSGGGCLNGTAVPSPLDNPGLVSDCESLLEGFKAMRGDATIHLAQEPWSGGSGDSPPLWSVERDLTVTSDSEETGWSYREFFDGSLDIEEGARVDPVTNRVSWVEMVRTLRGSGVVPASFGNLEGLTYLRLVNYESVAGPIPDSYSNLTNLEYLYLNSLSLSGPIPSWIGNLTSLKGLILSRGLTGAIPDSIGNLTNLTKLSLNANSLSGRIPASLGNLSNVERLDLSNNALIGRIPAELGNLSSVQYLYLNKNKLSGSIPSELGNLNVWYLNLKDNPNLTGCIPASLKTYTRTYQDGTVRTHDATIYAPDGTRLRGTRDNDNALWCDDES